KDIL
ncbi:hypothetical protein TNIN_390671, partial [Trichonephila inaurata madagascariensis]